jgi:signal transduction histidine kinase
MKEAHDIGVTFIDDGNPKPLSDELRNMLYTGARELLMNTVKHADARHVWIDLSRRNGEVLLAIEDDGIGFDVIPQYRDNEHPGSGFGLVNLRERLKHLGGRVEIESTKGKGTRVTLTVPVAENSANHEPTVNMNTGGDK